MSTPPPPPTSFPVEVVDAVCSHMNDDHPDDCLLIVRGLGGAGTATEARMTGLDGAAARFEVVLADGAVEQVQVPFAEPVTDRPQIRLGVVRLYHDACEALGVTPRPAEEH